MNNCAKWMLFLIILSGNMVKAQQEPTYTYMFNTQAINPAYAGTWGTMGFMVLAREQWIGIDNAPSTQTFAFQTLSKNEAVGLGLNIYNDKFGFEKRLGVYGDYSYRLKLDDELKLRLGLKLGFSSYSHNLGEHTLINENDPRFQGNIEHKFMPNFGIGAFLYKDRYYVGLSIPRIINNTYTGDGTNFSTQAEIRHFYMMAGYVFDLSEKLKFKPTVTGKVVSGMPLQYDFNANFLIADRVWLGAQLRTGDSFGFMAQWIISNSLRFGYAVDFATTELRSYQNGTHEIMISYELNNLKKDLGVRLF